MSIPNTIKLLKFEAVDIIGSYSDVNLKYFSDVDSQEFLDTSKTYQEILEAFQDKIRKGFVAGCSGWSFLEPFFETWLG